MAANVTVLTKEDCQKRFDSQYIIYPAMLCAGGDETDACQVTIADTACKRMVNIYVIVGRFWGSSGVRNFNREKSSSWSS